MKVKLRIDEVYPCLIVNKEFLGGEEVEIPDELYNKFCKLSHELQLAEDEIQEIWDKQEKTK
jgi:hypothetical protein